MSRVYLDWNATAPLRPEARAAMIAAMDVLGNPSSVHTEGRAAKGIIEKARAQVAEAAGAAGADMIFTSSATEAAALALAEQGYQCANIEHDCISAWATPTLDCQGGKVDVMSPANTSLQIANSESGIIQDLPNDLAMTDAVQAFGKIPFAFNWCGATRAILSAHKIGGPKGIGALIVKRGTDVPAQLKGGGQEMGRRSGTENVIGIAGFGAAAQAAQRDLDAGVWDEVRANRDAFEAMIQDAAPDVIIFGKDVSRLPNTSNFAIPGWKGETQVMQMDLAGFAISAGSACSSGKVKASRVLKAMGYDDITAASAIRVSIGPTTTKAELTAFADTWIEHYRRFKSKAA